MAATAVAECPAKVIQLLHYRDVQVGAEIAALMAPEVVVVLRESGRVHEMRIWANDARENES